MGEKTTRTNGIQIDDKFGILVMPIDYALAKIRKGKDGKVYFTPYHYFGSIQKCLEDYLKEAVHSDLGTKGYISLNEAVETIVHAFSRSAQALEKCFPEYEVRKKGGGA
jgi:hypothetical protein